MATILHSQVIGVSREPVQLRQSERLVCGFSSQSLSLSSSFFRQHSALPQTYHKPPSKSLHNESVLLSRLSVRLLMSCIKRRAVQLQLLSSNIETQDYKLTEAVRVDEAQAGCRSHAYQELSA